MISGKQGGIHESISGNEISFFNRRQLDSLTKSFKILRIFYSVLTWGREIEMFQNLPNVLRAVIQISLDNNFLLLEFPSNLPAKPISLLNTVACVAF